MQQDSMKPVGTFSATLVRRGSCMGWTARPSSKPRAGEEKREEGALSKHIYTEIVLKSGACASLRGFAHIADRRPKHLEV